MIFWSSSESSSQVTPHLREVRKCTEPLINQQLDLASLESKWDGWKWAFIAIILISPALGVEYPERVRCSKTNRVLEFRLKVDFGEFLGASRAGHIELMFKQLHRSVDLMAKYAVSIKGRETLHQILVKVEADAGICR